MAKNTKKTNEQTKKVKARRKTFLWPCDYLGISNWQKFLNFRRKKIIRMGRTEEDTVLPHYTAQVHSENTGRRGAGDTLAWTKLSIWKRFPFPDLALHMRLWSLTSLIRVVLVRRAGTQVQGSLVWNPIAFWHFSHFIKPTCGTKEWIRSVFLCFFW